MNRLTALWTVVMVLAACSEPASKPTTTSFDADPASIQASESSTLRWSVNGATSLSIDHGVGDVTGETSVSVTPEATTTYTLTATNSAGSSSAQTTVTVTPAASGFEVYAGPFDVGNPEPWTQFLIYDDIPAEDFPAEGESALVTVTGPEGWGEFSYERTRASFERGWSAPGSQNPAVAGEYRIEATLNGNRYAGTATLSDPSLLPAPENITVTAPSAISVSADWDAVPGAQSYYVGLATPDRSVVIAGENITATTMTFADLELSPGSYRVEVVAYTFDTSGPTPPKPSSVKAAYGTSSPFALPLPEAVFYPVDATGAYLPRAADDPANPATALQLSVLGVAPGECLGLLGAGDYSPRILDDRPDASTSMIGVFRGSSGFVAPGLRGTHEPIVTPETSDGTATDIPEDFDLRGLMVIAEVPSGATELLASPNDTSHGDNGDPDGDYGIYAAKVACP